MEDPGTQKEVMKRWFDEHFGIPEDAGAGGSQVIHQGLVGTPDALRGEFSGMVHERLIDESVAEIEDESLGCSQWIARPE